MYDLTANNTLQLTAQAEQLIVFDNEKQLDLLCEVAKISESVFILGGGSNVVLMPKINSLVIRVATKGIKLIQETAHHYFIQSMAGEIWHDFVQYCINMEWNGLENLALIPGTVGAAPVQNIGAYGVELSKYVDNVEVFDLNTCQYINFSAAECHFSYRSSLFKQQAKNNKWLIVSVTFKLPKIWSPCINYPDLQKSNFIKSKLPNISAADVFKAVIQIRQQKLPNPEVLPNAGSFFQNPIISAENYHKLKQDFPDMVAYENGANYKVAAAWLIQYCGYKGKKFATVGMHKNQALVLVNYGGATANDVLELANRIKKDVFDVFGINIQLEPVLVV